MKKTNLQHLARTTRRALEVIETLYPCIEAAREESGRVLVELEDVRPGLLTHDLARLLVDLPEVAGVLERLAARETCPDCNGRGFTTTYATEPVSGDPETTHTRCLT